MGVLDSIEGATLMRIPRLAGVLLATAAPFGAEAAPQMLGLTQTVGLTPLYCDGGECTAELTAFCLQQERDMPRVGTAYTPVDARRITLHITRADGTVVSLPAGKHARFKTARGQFAVRLSVPAELVRKMGASRVAVSVGQRVTLAPEPVPGDKHPLTRTEIDRAAGALRATAEVLVDRDQPDAVAARAMNRIINLLPHGDDTDPRWRRSLWAKATAGIPKRGRTADGLAMVAIWQGICRGYRLVPGAYRHCLESGHDSFIGRVNRDYWRVIGPGS